MVDLALLIESRDWFGSNNLAATGVQRSERYAGLDHAQRVADHFAAIVNLGHDPISAVLVVGRNRSTRPRLRGITPAQVFEDALLGADRAEDVGGSGPLVAWRAGAGATLRPAARDFVLLADAGLIGEPNFYRVAVDALRARDRFQTRGEAFLKFSIAPAACVW